MTQPQISILLVEDDEDDYILTQQLLREIDQTRYHLHWVRQYDLALHEACSAKHDVCLVDYRLDERNGVEWLRDAIAHGCQSPIILLTGQGDHEIDMAAMEAGAADFLSKSQISVDLLERSIRYAIQHQKVTEQRLRLLEEQAARAEAEAANRAKDRFLAMLSHELRTPLSPVVLCVATIESDPDLPPRLREEFAMIRRNIDLETKLIDDLLDLSRVINGKLRLQTQPVRLHELLDHVLHSSTGFLDDGRLKIHSDFEATNDFLIADPARLQQVFWNLLRNAMKFTPEGGDIFVRTWNAGASGDVCVEVKDTGLGIEVDVLPRIFDAFEQGETTTVSEPGGLGLGLPIAKGIVEMHGGMITATSGGKAQGATFTVRLGTAAAPASEGIPRSPATPTGLRAHARILLVEDHEDTARVLAKVLKSSGYTVETAGTVASALDLAAANQFDILISDIGLPDASGYELMRQISDRYGIKGIALSGYGTEDDLRRSREAGFADHVTKPVNLAQLESIIRRVTSEETQTVPGIVQWPCRASSSARAEPGHDAQPDVTVPPPAPEHPLRSSSSF